MSIHCQNEAVDPLYGKIYRDAPFAEIIKEENLTGEDFPRLLLALIAFIRTLNPLPVDRFIRHSRSAAVDIYNPAFSRYFTLAVTSGGVFFNALPVARATDLTRLITQSGLLTSGDELLAPVSQSIVWHAFRSLESFTVVPPCPILADEALSSPHDPARMIRLEFEAFDESRKKLASFEEELTEKVSSATPFQVGYTLTAGMCKGYTVLERMYLITSLSKSNAFRLATFDGSLNRVVLYKGRNDLSVYRVSSDGRAECLKTLAKAAENTGFEITGAVFRAAFDALRQFSPSPVPAAFRFIDEFEPAEEFMAWEYQNWLNAQKDAPDYGRLFRLPHEAPPQIHRFNQFT